MLLQNKNIQLRALEPEDIDILYKRENDSDIWEVSNTLVPFSKYILTKYIKNSHLDIFETKQLRLMIYSKSENKTVGMIDLFDFEPFHKRAGVGIVIFNEFRNKNYASEALEVFINYCFEHLQLHQLYCNIAKDNTASIKLFQKHGFEIAGTKREWINTATGFKDEYFLQLIS